MFTTTSCYILQLYNDLIIMTTNKFYTPFFSKQIMILDHHPLFAEKNTFILDCFLFLSQLCMVSYLTTPPHPLSISHCI